MAIEETIREISNGIPVIVPLIGLGAITLGTMAYGAVRLYKNTKAINSQFDYLNSLYEDNMNKQDLLAMYGNLEKFVRPNIVGRRRKIADMLSEKLEGQIMKYATQEVLDFISSGNTLDFYDPIESVSPTYKTAQEIISK